VEITKEYLERQAQELSQEAAKLMTRLNQIRGAVAHCEALIMELEIPEPEEENLEVVENEDEAEV